MTHFRAPLSVLLLALAGLSVLPPGSADAKRIKGSVKATVNGKPFKSNQKKATFATVSGFLSITGTSRHVSRRGGGTQILNLSCPIPAPPLPVTAECTITFTDVSVGLGGGSSNTANGPVLVAVTALDAKAVAGTIADVTITGTTSYSITGGKFRVPVVQ